jgi:hypothetical protein
VLIRLPHKGPTRTRARRLSSSSVPALTGVVLARIERAAERQRGQRGFDALVNYFLTGAIPRPTAKRRAKSNRRAAATTR